MQSSSEADSVLGTNREVRPGLPRSPLPPPRLVKCYGQIRKINNFGLQKMLFQNNEIFFQDLKLLLIKLTYLSVSYFCLIISVCCGCRQIPPSVQMVFCLFLPSLQTVSESVGSCRCAGEDYKNNYSSRGGLTASIQLPTLSTLPTLPTITVTPGYGHVFVFCSVFLMIID